MIIDNRALLTSDRLKDHYDELLDKYYERQSLLVTIRNGTREP